MELGRRSYLAGAAAGVALALAGCIEVPGDARVERSETRSQTVGDAAALTVSNVNGDVTVGTHDGDAVRVDVTKRGPFEAALDRVTVETRRDGGTIVVETVAPDRSFSNVSVTLDVRVPADLPVTSVETVNGHATVRGTVGDATVATTNGDATAEDVDGFVTTRTVNGTATATGTTGFDGSSAVNGGVEAEIRAVRGDTAAETTNGEVSVTVDESIDLAVVMETNNGALAVEGVDLTDATYGRHRVTGRLNDGGPTLRARTGNGRVELHPLGG